MTTVGSQGSLTEGAVAGGGWGTVGRGGEGAAGIVGGKETDILPGGL